MVYEDIAPFLVHRMWAHLLTFPSLRKGGVRRFEVQVSGEAPGFSTPQSLPYRKGFAPVEMTELDMRSSVECGSLPIMA